MKPKISIILNKFRLGTDQLWPLVVLGGFVFFASLVPLPPNDFWWHLKIGEILFVQKTIPTSNLFSWTLPPDHPFVYGAWLGELLLYGLYHLGKLELVIFARNILISLTFWLVGVEIKRRSSSWRIGTLGIALLAAMTLNNLVVRPQIWAWLVFMIFFVILSRYADQQIDHYWLFVCPILMVFWVNAHGSYILGGVLLGIFFIGEAIRTVFRMTNALSRNQVGWILLCGILTGVAIFINPQGLNTVNYVINLMTDQPSQNLIIEWQSPSTQGISNIAFYITVLVMVASFSYSKRKPTPTELLLICSFTWLAWTGMRYIIWFGLVSIPILMNQMANLPIRTPNLIPHRNYLNFILAVLFFLPSLFVQPWFVENFPLPERYSKMVQRGSPEGPLLNWDNPVSAVNYLRTHPGGKLFNEMGYGSYLIWALEKQNVFIDPRVELYPFEQWEDYLRITRAVRYNPILEHYGVERILLNKELQPELALALETDPIWRKEYEDMHSQIWQKTNPE
jgi:hypothetical protein